MKKKIISLFIILTMILPNLVGVVFADTTDGVFFWNSMAYSTNKDTANTEIILNNNVDAKQNIVTVDRAVDNDRVAVGTSDVAGIPSFLKIGKNYAYVAGYLDGTIEHMEAIDGTTTLASKYGNNATLNFEFDLNVNNPKEDNSEIVFGLGVGSSADNDALAHTKAGTKVYFKDSGVIYTTNGYEYSSKSDAYNYTMPRDTSYENNKWYRYRLAFKLTDAQGSAEERYTLYLDGVEIGTWQYLDVEENSNGAGKGIKHIIFNVTQSGSVTRNVGVASMGVANLTAYMSGDNYVSSSTESLAVNIRTEKADYDAYAGNRDVTALSEYTAYKNAYDTAVGVISAPYTMTAATDDYDAADNKYTQAQIDGYWTAVQTAKTALDAKVDEMNAASYPGGELYKATYDDEKYDPAFDIGNAKVNTMECIDKSGEERHPIAENVENGLVMWTGTQDLSAYDAATNKDEYTTGTFNQAAEGPNATLVTQFDIRFDDLAARGGTLAVQMMDRDAWSNATKSSWTVPVNFNINDFVDIEDGKWYRIRVELYSTNDSSAPKHRYSVWIDGVQKITEGQYGLNGVTGTSSYQKFPQVDSIHINLTGGSKDYGMTYSIDNVLMYKKNEANPMPVNDGALVSAIREWEEYYNLTGDSVVNTALTAAKAAYNDADRTQTTVDTATAALLAAVADSNLTEDASPYVIEGFKFTDAEGKAATEPVEGGKLSEVILSQDGKYTGTEKVLVAAYDGTTLADAKLFDIADNPVAGDTVSVATNITIPAGAAGKYTYKAYIWNGTSAIRPLAGAFEQSVLAQDRTVEVHVIGDSIAEYNAEGNALKRAGWGQTFANWFNVNANVTVENHASGGRSSKSFYNEDGKWNTVKAKLSKGDYLFIAFMHNDQKNEEILATDVNSTYREYLNRYIREARATGAIPVLVTSIPRLMFHGSDHSGAYYGYQNMGAYPLVMGNVATTYGVPCLDTFSVWAGDVKTKGYDTAKTYHCYLDGENANLDTTHLSTYGADVLSGIIVDKLGEYVSPFSGRINTEYNPQEPAGE